MQQRHAVIGQQARHFGEELAVVRNADVLEHADRNDAVEAARHCAIVDQLETHPTGKPAFGGALGGESLLFDRQRHAGHIDAGRFRQIHGHAAPAATDVEHPLAGLQVDCSSLSSGR